MKVVDPNLISENEAEFTHLTKDQLFINNDHIKTHDHKVDQRNTIGLTDQDVSKHTRNIGYCYWYLLTIKI